MMPQEAQSVRDFPARVRENDKIPHLHAGFLQNPALRIKRTRVVCDAQRNS